MKIKVIAIILSVVLVVGIGAGVGFAIYNNAPQNVAARAVGEAVEDLFEREEVKPVVKMLSGGSLEWSVGDITSETQGVLFSGDISGKAYFAKNELMLKDVNVEYEDISVSGELYLSDDMIYISESEILDGAYGVKFSEFVRDLENSIFAYGSGSEYAIDDEDTYDSIIEFFESVEDSERMQKDAEKLVKKHGKKMWKIVADNVQFETENDKLRLNGEKTNVRVISIIADGHAISNIVADLYEYLREDESIGDFLDRYGDAYVSLVDEGADEDKTLGQLYEEYLDGLEDKIDDICHDVEQSLPVDITVKVVTPRHSDKLLKISADVEDVEIFSVDFGAKGAKKTDKITVRFDDFKLTYEVEQNDRQVYEGELKINGERILNIYVDKEREDYTLTFNNGRYAVRGDISTGGGRTVITVEEYEERYTTYDEDFAGKDITKTVTCDVTLIIDEKDKMPEVPKNYDRISDITDEDVEAWFKNLEKILAKIPLE